MAYIEPCCAENQIPQLLRREKGNALFQTNGDVTIEKLMQAACCMASGGFGEYWIVVREADVVLMRTLAHWIDRGWIRQLRLLTEGDQTALVTSELGTERMRSVEYAWREGLSAAQMFCCVGDRETIVVQGEMLLAASPSPRVTSYSATLGPNTRMLGSEGAAGSLIENLRAILKVQKRKARKKKDAEAEEPKAEEAVGQDTAGTVPAVAEVADDSTEGLSPSVSPAPEEPKSDEQPEATDA